MLHLHALIWVRGNLDFIYLRDRTLADDLFASRMIQYLESIIVHGLHDVDPRTGPSASGSELDTEFLQKLSRDSNRVARTEQLHSKHLYDSSTCSGL